MDTQERKTMRSFYPLPTDGHAVTDAVGLPVALRRRKAKADRPPTIRFTAWRRRRACRWVSSFSVPTNDVAHDPSVPFVHYYDQHPTREDLMGESVIQAQIIRYLAAVLEWLYHQEGWFVATNLNIYRQPQYRAYPLAPDVAVFKGVRIENPNQRALRSWRMYEPGRPAPQVVFEIASDTTWKDDLRRKPIQYALLGVQEYFAYDPNQPPYFARQRGRVRGWRRAGRWLHALTPDPQGRLWSAELESYLVVEGDSLRLYDRAGQRRLTESEAAWAQLEAEQAAKEAERAAKEAERAAKEAERAAKEAAWAKLRALGIDPEAE